MTMITGFSGGFQKKIKMMNIMRMITNGREL